MLNTLEAWLGNRYPTVLAAYHVENEKLDALAALERTIAEATEEARRIREELGMTPPFLDPVPNQTRARLAEDEPVAKKRTRKSKPEPAPEPEEEPAEVIEPDKFVTTEDDAPATDEGDFEDYEIPSDDEDDEF